MDFAGVLMVAAQSGGGPGYSAAANAYFAAMTTPPTAARKTLLNNLIVGLQSDGVWTKLDWLSIMAAETAQTARVNAVTPAQVASVVGSPTFTTDRGYTGDGVGTAYLNTGWNPATAGGNFTQNSASQGVWVGTDVNSSTNHDAGNGLAEIISRGGTTSLTVRGNSASADSGTLPSNTSVGFSSWARSNSANFKIYKNGSTIATPTRASAAAESSNFFICATNFSGTPSGGSRRIQAAFWGSALDDTEMAALYNRLATYMTAVGA